MADRYPVTCPHCGLVIDSYDSYADSRSLRDEHLLHAHPDLPDPTPDARFR